MNKSCPFFAHERNSIKMKERGNHLESLPSQLKKDSCFLTWYSVAWLHQYHFPGQCFYSVVSQISRNHSSQLLSSIGKYLISVESVGWEEVVLLEPQRDFERDIGINLLDSFLVWKVQMLVQSWTHNWMDDEAITFRLCLVFMIILLTTK